jgi:phage-related tail protein
MNRGEKQDSREKDIEQLETLAFHFTQLSKRLSQDREHWAETGKDLTKACEKLDKTIQQFAELEKKLKEQVTAVLQQESREAAWAIAKACRETTQKVLTEQINTIADYLSRAVYQAGGTLADYQGEIKSLRKWFLIGITLSALVGNILGGIFVYYLLAA